MSDTSIIVGSAVSLVAVCGVLIKFTIHAVFVSLQKQITILSEAAVERDKEIINLRSLIDSWQEKYYLLSLEYSKLQSQHEHLKREFDRMKVRSHVEGV